MAKIFDKNVYIGIAGLVGLLVLSAALAYWNTNQLNEDAAWVAHTQEVLDSTANLLRTLVDAETGLRGFVITGDDEFLQPFDAALPHFDAQLATLKALTKDNPRQQDRLKNLEAMAAAHVVLLKKGVGLRRQSEQEARAFIATKKPKQQMDAIRTLVAEMEDEEHELLKIRERRSSTTFGIAIFTSLFTAVVGLAAIAAFVRLLRRSLLARQEAAAVVHEQRERLQTTLASIGDAVITTDARGRVTFLNPVAQNLTGWKEEAEGKELHEVFKIVNETSRQTVESPVMKALRDGAIVGLANHTILIARNGQEVPIDDSAAPIRVAGGAIVGVVLVFRDITVRKQAERALRESEERFARFMHHFAGLAWIKDVQGRYVYANDAAAIAFGHPLAELLGKNDHALFPAETAAQFVENDRQALASATGIQSVEAMWEEGRGVRYSFVSKFPILGENGQALWVGGMAIDITDRMEAEKASRESEERYRVLADTLPHMVWSMGNDLKLAYLNRKASEFTGLTVEQVNASGWDRLIHPEDRAGMLATVSGPLSRGEAHEVEYRFLHHSGEYRRVISRAVPVKDDAGNVVQWVGATQDIHDRWLAEERLRESESKFRQLADTIPQLAWMARPDGHIYWYNQQWYNYTGTTPEAMEGWGWQSVHDPVALPKVLERWQASIANGQPFDMVFPLRGAGGQFRSFLTRIAPLRSPEGKVLQWFGTNTDISDQINMEEALRGSQAELEDRVRERTEAAEARAQALAKSEAALREQTRLMGSILNSIGEGVVVADANGRFILFNPAAETILGVGLTDASQDQWSDVYGIFHTDGSTPFPANDLPIARAIRGESTDDCELYVRNPRVPGWHITVTGRPMLSENGSVTGGVVVFRDLTARKLAEDGMKQAKEAAERANRAKSEFLANMSHEIRTPMNGIIGMTELVLDTPLNSGQREHINSVKVSAESLLTVINDILDFAKIEAGKLELDLGPFSLRDSLGDLLKPLALRGCKKGLKIDCHVAANVPDALFGDLGRLRQVIINFVGNAIKFTERGEVVVHVEVEEQTEQQVGLHVWVSDTGIGIPDDKQATIFAPFEQADNSLARRYGGTGLGLAIAARLVEIMGGRTWLTSSVGEGSTFHFTVRLGLEEKTDACLPVPGAVPVLIVDDNATAQNILVEMLIQWGMKPIVVSDEKAALAELNRGAESGAPFRLVIVDAALLHSSLGERIELQKQAGLAVILLSSPADLDTERNFSYRVTKPIKQSDLLDAIQMALAEPLVDGKVAKQDVSANPVKDGNVELVHRPMRILLAEDNPINQKVAIFVLEKAGHKVILVNNGREAVAALERDCFDVVLMDVQMPEMDGLEATAAIRQGEVGTGRHIPIIALTAHALKGDRERFLAAGMDEAITKPFRKEELWKAIANCASAAAKPDAINSH